MSCYKEKHPLHPVSVSACMNGWWFTFLCFSAEHTNCASVVPFNNNSEMLYILFAAIKSIYQIILFCLSDMKKNVQIFAVLKPQMFFFYHVD